MSANYKLTLIVPLLLVCSIATAEAKTIRRTFYVSYISGSPDGVWSNTILGINGKFPGPLIEGEVGDTLEVTVINGIQDGQNVTIHWHGIHQKDTPFEDGPAQVTQCPLKQGSIQVYKFPLRQPGTYWYHSHVNSQYTEGLWGSLIVRNTPEIWQNMYDEELLITVNDWYHTSAKENEEWFLRPESLGAPPYPFSALMNGVGRYPCDSARSVGRFCNVYSQKRPVYYLSPRKTYRLRLINTSGWLAFNFTVEGHTLRVIEVDGVDTLVGAAANAVYIGAGQRYSFLLTADQSSKSTEFLIRASLRREFLFTRPNNINQFPNSLIGEVTGVISFTNNGRGQQSDSPLINPSYQLFDYTRANSINSQWTWGNLRFVRELDLVPADRVTPPNYFDQNIDLEITFSLDENGIRRGSFNNSPFYVSAGKPQLVKMIEGLEQPATTFPVYLKYGEVIQLVVSNPEEGPHPLHLHGHHFWVMGMGHSGDGPYNPDRHSLNYSGHRRDTVMIHEKSWLVIRFRADNPGLWSLHCHIDWHNLSGMGMTFVEAPELASSIKITSEARRVCAEHNVFI